MEPDHLRHALLDMHMYTLAHEAMAEEMRRFYEEEDLYTYEEGSTPSMDKDSYDGIPGEDENGKILLVTRDRLEQSLAKSNVSNVREDSVQPIELQGHI